jgi:SAM-dependent methyltransferase
VSHAPSRRPEVWSAGAAGYESAFAPFTGPFADDVLALVDAGPGVRLLDVAAGSGAVARRAAALGAEVLATDFAPGMVSLLEQRLREDGRSTARTAVMDGQALGLPDGSFDVALSMFGVIFFPSMDRGAAELARVTRPGGRVAVGTWRLGGFRLIELVGEALAAVLPGFDGPPQDPAWAQVGDANGLTALLAASGLTEVAVRTVTHPFDLPDPVTFFRHLPNWSPPVQPLFEALDDQTIDTAASAFADAYAAGCAPGGGVPTDALIGIGTVAHR